ncbi:MAG TPA: hypothetical protein VFS17_00040 [Methylophilaceae bacterium]|nr:hypothetical protein [Methylophilaceae bacterium]
MKRIALAALLLSIAAAAHARPAFTGKNYSGIYSCSGSNELIGDYDVTIILKLNRISSHGRYGTYDYETETTNSNTYTGQAIADGNRLAISFRFNGKSINGRGHSIGIATIKKDKRGRWSFRKDYYEPDDNGGNYGHEYCTYKEALPEPSPSTPEGRPAKHEQSGLTPPAHSRAPA